MQFKQAGQAVSSPRAKRRELYRPHDGQALLTIYFGIEVCKEYIHASIAQDFQDDPSLAHANAEEIFELSPELQRAIDYLARQARRRVELLHTQNIQRYSDETMVDHNATKPLRIIEV